MTAISTVRIEQKDIPNSFKVFEEYMGDYTIKCWPDIEKIKELFENENIVTEIAIQTNIIEITLDTVNLHKAVDILEKYDFIHK